MFMRNKFKLLRSKFLKYRFIIFYGIFGVLTTIINVVTYGVLYNVLNITNVISTIIAWVVAVLFAFVTNKIWVFESKTFERKLFILELQKFFGCRIATGLLDVGIMFIGVDILNGPAILLKLFANILVIVLNYIMSKFIVFKKN